MRRSSLVLLAFFLTASGASAALGSAEFLRTPGAQSLELRNGNGRAVVTKRGSVLVSIGRGQMRVVDRPGGVRPRRDCNKRPRRISATTTQYRGIGVRCFVWGRGPWQVVIRGRDIDASGVVRGSLTLDAVDEGPTGQYRIGRRAFRAWPRAAHTYVLRR